MSLESTSRRKGARPASLLHLAADGRDYPVALHEAIGGVTPPHITALGNLDILQNNPLALFCSTQCPGKLILETYDLAQALRDTGVTVVSGFHTPMEQECLRLLLRGRQPIVICPARSIERLRVPEDWRGALTSGRLLVLSAFGANERRATAELALRRNRVVAALAERVFIAYAAPGSRTETFARELVVAGKPLLTLEAPENAGLVALGAEAIRAASFREATVPVNQAPTGPPGAVPLPLFDE